MVMIGSNDYLTQQYIASNSAYGDIATSYMTESLNPYNTSIFGTGYGMYGGGSVQQMTAYNNQLADSNLAITRKNTVVNALMTSPEQAIEREMGTLQRQIYNNDQENIQETYAKVYNETKAMFAEAGYADVPDSQIKAYIENKYYTLTQSRLVDDIEAKGGSSFVKGMVQGTGIGYFLTDKRSKEDNIEMITGEKESTSSKIAKWAGRIVGAVATVVAAPFVAKYGAKGVKAVAKGYAAVLTR